MRGDYFLPMLWEGSWDEGALVQDKARSIHADPGLIHRIHHEGERYRVEGPHFVAPSPQKRPVLWQAGSSEQGREFAAKHAESVFGIFPTPKSMRAYADDIRILQGL